MKKNQKRYNAYFSVEASLLVPLAFLLIVLLLYYGFFCYEKMVSLQCCYLAALRGSNEWELSGNALESFVSEELQTLLGERCLYQIEGKKEVNASVLGIEVSFDAYMKVPFSKIRGDNIEGWEINGKKNARRNVPSAYIRKYQLIKNSGGEYGGSNQQK